MSDELQFDRAEAQGPQRGPQVPCAACKRPLAGEYYLAGGAKICADCKTGLNQYVESGSKKARFLKATALGGLAALVGGILWAVFIVTTNSMWGFVAIGLGYLVGIAVRKGSEGRGGRAYQFLGLGLVYMAVATGYMGIFISQVGGQKPAPVPAAVQPADPAAEPKADPTAPSPAPDAGGYLQAWAILLGFYLAGPILIAKVDPFSLLFLAIAFWEAWRLNSGANLKVSGPYKLGG